MIEQRSVIRLVLFALAVLSVAWLGTRHLLEAQVTAAARRDLDSIAEFVALDLRRLAGPSPAASSARLASEVADPASELAKALLRTEDGNHRRVFFFDAAGRCFWGGQDQAGIPAHCRPAIIDVALPGDPGVDRQGELFSPYRDIEEEDAVGVWRWISGIGVGIVVERPYATFVRPIRWLDGLFFGTIAFTLILGSALSGFGPGDIRRAFRRTDINRCGPYEIRRLIGEGAMANVYAAFDTRLQRTVALKRLKIHARRDEQIARFEREARLASQFHHPNLVSILDHGRDDEGNLYYTMEFVRGLTLTDWVEQHGPLPPPRAIRIVRQITQGVAALHDRHLLHRDIKPDNVMAYATKETSDLVKLLDFGLIRNLDHQGSRDLTRGVRVLGTPAYMAPERLSGSVPVGFRSDLYGIGCVAFYLLTGRRPFESEADGDLVHQVLHVPPPPVSTQSPFPVTEEIDELIAALLAKDPMDRPADARTLELGLLEIEGRLGWNAGKARLWWASVLPETGRRK